MKILKIKIKIHNSADNKATKPSENNQWAAIKDSEASQEAILLKEYIKHNQNNWLLQPQADNYIKI